MNRRPGQIEVVTEVGYCPSCGRTRNLRREQHHLGQLVRTIVTCETCHRTLSSSIGVATVEPIKAEPDPVPVLAVAPAVRSTTSAARPVKKVAPAKKKAAPAKKPAARKPTAKKPSGKPTSTATRKSTRRK